MILWSSVWCGSQLLNHRLLSRDEICTLFQECAAIVNETPLYEISSDPNDPPVITPAMLLTLRDDSNGPPLENLNESDLLAYGRSRYRRVLYLSQQFFKRWKTLYLSNLQYRNKWLNKKRNFQIGDIVLLRESYKRTKWPIARVVDVKLGTDSLVRTVSLQLGSKNEKTRTLTRSIHDIVLLIKSREAWLGGMWRVRSSSLVHLSFPPFLKFIITLLLQSITDFVFYLTGLGDSLPSLFNHWTAPFNPENL